MTSALLACAMARRGYHCGILDADITGPSIPKLFGIHGRAMADEKGCWPKMCIRDRLGTLGHQLFVAVDHLLFGHAVFGIAGLVHHLEALFALAQAEGCLLYTSRCV